MFTNYWANLCLHIIFFEVFVGRYAVPFCKRPSSYYFGNIGNNVLKRATICCKSNLGRRKNKLQFIKLTNNYLLRFIESMEKGVIMWKKDVKISQEDNWN